MKLINILLITILIAVASAIPWKSQIALANSLEVGRDQDPNTWDCHGCDRNNKPLHTYIIEQSAKDVKCSLAVYSEYTVLAFRYTNSIKNIGQDLLWAIQTQDQEAPSGCKVQKQMDGMWNSIKSDVIKGLRKTVHTGRLIITGISLGGALATLSYVDIKHAGIFTNVEIITYGAPRVGNKKWAAWFNTVASTQRYFIKGDPIAGLPICLTLLCNYGQTGRPISCNQKAKVCTVNREYQILSFSDIIDGLSKAFIEHKAEEESGLDAGIISHIYEYKNLMEYTQVN